MSCCCGDQSCSCVGKCHCPFHFCLCIACFNLRKSTSVKIKERSETFRSALGLSRGIQKYEGTGTNFNYDGEKFTQISNLNHDELENEVVYIGTHNTNKKASSSSNARVSEIVLSDSDCEVVFEIQNSSNDIEWIDVEEKRSSKKTLGDLNRKRNRKVKSVCSSSNIITNSKCKSHKRSWSNRKSDQNEIYGSNISSFLNHPQVSLVKHENISAQDYKNIHVKEDNVGENWVFSQKSSICGAFNAQENKSIQETSVVNFENEFLKSEYNQYINGNSGTNRYSSQDSSNFNDYEGQENETTEKLFPNVRNNFPELKTNMYGSYEQYFCFKSEQQKISRNNSGSERNGQNSETSVKYGENSASFGQRTDLSLPVTTVVQANERSKEVGSQSSNFPENHHEKLPDFNAYDYVEKNIEKSMRDRNLFSHPKFYECHEQSGLVTAYPTLTERKYSENDFFQIIDDDESGCKYVRNEKEVSVQNLSNPSSSNSCYNNQETYNHPLQKADGATELSYKAARNKHNSFQNSSSHDSLEICNDSIGTRAIRKRIRKKRLKGIKKEDVAAKICTINEIIQKKAPVRWIRRRRRRKRTIRKKKKTHIKTSDCVKEIKKFKVEIKTEIKKEIKKEYV